MEDVDQCLESGILEKVTFATKPVLARQRLQRVFDADLDAHWVTADERDSKFRRFLKKQEMGRW